MRRAFTLIEMLVTLAVLAALLSLIVPALGRARDQGLTATCQMQQRSLAQSLTLLASARRGGLPTGPVELGGWFTDPNRGSPIELYNAHRAASGLTQEDGWYGLGLLWKEGLLDGGKAFYCPARALLGRGYTHSWPRQFTGTTPADGKTSVITSYAYRGGLASQAGTARGPLRMERHSADTATFADDPLYGVAWHDDGYNVAFLGGHVRWYAFESRPVPDTRLWLLWPHVDGD